MKPPTCTASAQEERAQLYQDLCDWCTRLQTVQPRTSGAARRPSHFIAAASWRAVRLSEALLWPPKLTLRNGKRAEQPTCSRRIFPHFHALMARESPELNRTSHDASWSSRYRKRTARTRVESRRLRELMPA